MFEIVVQYYSVRAGQVVTTVASVHNTLGGAVNHLEAIKAAWADVEDAKFSIMEV